MSLTVYKEATVFILRGKIYTTTALTVKKWSLYPESKTTVHPHYQLTDTHVHLHYHTWKNGKLCVVASARNDTAQVNIDLRSATKLPYNFANYAQTCMLSSMQ